MFRALVTPPKQPVTALPGGGTSDSNLITTAEAGSPNAWPTPQEYNEAIQNPAVAFSDAELQSGHPELNSLGLPKPISGAFASVYRIHCAERDWAVKCFLHPLSDQAARYQQISQHLKKHKLRCMINFEFVEQGIRIRNKWFPILKMEWADGVPLNDYLSGVIRYPNKIAAFEKELLKMMKSLSDAGIAHGDLQHGNILVSEGQIKLVDYDGMYVPSMNGMLSSELGHRNYQHPTRAPHHFGPYLDNFSAWVIYSSLVCLRNEPEFWPVFQGGDECLLLRQFDFRDPFSSVALYSMENHPSPEVQACSELIRAFSKLAIERIPILSLRTRARSSR
jgi:serine/threonine protein kinase